MGFAAARMFAEAGAAVVLSDCDEAALARPSPALRPRANKVLGVTCDVADEAQVSAMVRRTVDTYAAWTPPSTTPASRSRPTTSWTSPTRITSV